MTGYRKAVYAGRIIYLSPTQFNARQQSEKNTERNIQPDI